MDNKIKELEEVSLATDRTPYYNKYRVVSTSTTKTGFSYFVSHKKSAGKLARVQITEMDWILIHCMCKGRCMATGFRLGRYQEHIDRAYDDLVYKWGYILIFLEL